MKVEWNRLENMTDWKKTTHEVPKPKGFIEGGRSFHEMYIDVFDNILAIGRTCCAYRQHGCAYLSSCKAQSPQDIPLGNITDYPEIENT